MDVSSNRGRKITGKMILVALTFGVAVMLLWGPSVYARKSRVPILTNIGSLTPLSITKSSQVLVYVKKTKQLAVWERGRVDTIPLKMSDEFGSMNSFGHVLINRHDAVASFNIWNGSREQQISSPLVKDDAGVFLTAKDEVLINDARGTSIFKDGHLRVLLRPERAYIIQARSINSRNEIVGYRVGPLHALGPNPLKRKSPSPALEQAFFYRKNKFRVLKSLGPNHIWAWSLNNSDEIVGYSRAKNALNSTAVYWPHPDAVPIVLQSLLPKNSGWVLETAVGINDRHQVVGSGTYQGVPSGFIMDLQ